jgi:hypothetical protein
MPTERASAGTRSPLHRASDSLAVTLLPDMRIRRIRRKITSRWRHADPGHRLASWLITCLVTAATGRRPPAWLAPVRDRPLHGWIPPSIGQIRPGQRHDSGAGKPLTDQGLPWLPSSGSLRQMNALGTAHIAIRHSGLARAGVETRPTACPAMPTEFWKQPAPCREEFHGKLRRAAE